MAPRNAAIPNIINGREGIPIRVEKRDPMLPPRLILGINKPPDAPLEMVSIIFNIYPINSRMDVPAWDNAENKVSKPIGFIFVIFVIIAIPIPHTMATIGPNWYTVSNVVLSNSISIEEAIPHRTANPPYKPILFNDNDW